MIKDLYIRLDARKGYTKVIREILGDLGLGMALTESEYASSNLNLVEDGRSPKFDRTTLIYKDPLSGNEVFKVKIYDNETLSRITGRDNAEDVIGFSYISENLNNSVINEDPMREAVYKTLENLKRDFVVNENMTVINTKRYLLGNY